MGKYTACLEANGGFIFQQYANEMEPLLITLLTRLELANSSAQGYIVHNDTGHIVHQCRKVAIE